MAGDVNARTGSCPEFIENDTSTHNPIPNHCYNVNFVKERRVSQYTMTYSRGKELLELCIGNQLRILNGRRFGNITGRFTCFKTNGSSIVDYMIASVFLLHQVLYVKLVNLKLIFQIAIANYL